VLIFIDNKPPGLDYDLRPQLMSVV